MGVAAVLYARRESETSFEARRLCDASYLEFVGARDAGLAERIDEALAADRGRPFALCAAMTATLRMMQRAGCMANTFASRVSRRTSFKERSAAELWDGPGVGLKLGPFNALNVLPYGRPAR